MFLFITRENLSVMYNRIGMSNGNYCLVKILTKLKVNALFLKSVLNGKSMLSVFSPGFFGVVGGGAGVMARRWEKC